MFVTNNTFIIRISVTNIALLLMLLNILRRGFTLNGQPIMGEQSRAGSGLMMEGEKMAVTKVREESNAYFFWAIYLTLLLIAAGNLVTTAVIISVLRIGPQGMEAIEFLPLESAVKLFGNADLGNVYQHNGVISGFAGEDLSIVGQDASITIQADNDDISPPRMTLSREGVAIENVHDLSLIDPDTGEVVFSTSDPELSLPEGVRHLETEETEVDSVVSGVTGDTEQPMMIRCEELSRNTGLTNLFSLRSDRKLTVRGAEGVEIEGRKVSLTRKNERNIIEK